MCVCVLYACGSGRGGVSIDLPVTVPNVTKSLYKLCVRFLLFFILFMLPNNGGNFLKFSKSHFFLPPSAAAVIYRPNEAKRLESAPVNRPLPTPCTQHQCFKLSIQHDDDTDKHTGGRRGGRVDRVAQNKRMLCYAHEN